jgi:Fur family ferric uptake transcriptional regulator
MGTALRVDEGRPAAAASGRARPPAAGIVGRVATRTRPAHPPAHERWAVHATDVLRGAGYRDSRPRNAVVGVLARQPCLLTAREIADRVRDDGRDVGTATVYRALEVLDELGLVRRLDREGLARYEPASPGGEHHHHLICDGCGEMSPFEDDALEHAIDRLAERIDYRVGGHEVVLRGTCPRCAAS